MKVKNWKNVKFMSSCFETEQFKDFAKDFKSEVKKMLEGFEIVKFNKGHFYVSMFIKNVSSGRMCYVNLADVRFDKNWYNNILIRTAKSDTDYVGGPNHYCSFDNLKEHCEKLTA